ncbi:hypothetical protein [Pontibacter sp. H249]|uniref:hypothetical protein n=1 Tax=Pontibacter sp. H249 TaxID=3133420 RepID=UPI0030C41029
MLKRNGMELGKHTLQMTMPGSYSLKASFRIEPHEDLSQLVLEVRPINWQDLGTPRSLGMFSRGYRMGEEAFFKTEWDVALNLPDIKQKDFLKSIRALFDLMVTFEPYSNTLHFTPFNKLEENKASALDWSDKLVYVGSPQVAVSYRFGDFAQKSWFRYKQDETGGNGDSYLTVDNAQLEREKNMVELPFAASAESGWGIVVPLFSPLESREFDHEVSDIAARNGHGAADRERVLVHNASGDPMVREGWAIYERVKGRYDSTDGWCLRQQEGDFYQAGKGSPRLAVTGGEAQATLRLTRTQAETRPTLRLDFTPISFQVLLPTRYTSLQGVLEKCKGITPYFTLNVQDVQEYDPSIPIWLDQFQGYFYLNQITEFTGEGPTECQLWRL